jgi:phage baseplate assembly protein W
MLTNNFERPFKPNFGANLRGLLFELADDMTKTEIRNQIIDALTMLEPRVRVEEIYLTNSRNNTMHVNLHYGVVGVKEPQELEVILQRVR